MKSGTGFYVSCHLVYGRDQRQPSHYQTVEVDLPPLGMAFPLLLESQTGNQSLPGTPVIGGFWLGTGQEIQLETEM